MDKNGFLKGAFILGVAGIIVKILGAFFRIPLGNIIGSEGLGYYQVGYPIFTFLLSFSAAGFPTAISKLVSEKRALGDHKGAHRVFQVSLVALTAVGIIGSLALGFGAKYLVNNIIQSPDAYYAVLALAPALFFVPIMAAFRGYFQGMKNMTPTAVSQVVEQMGRVIIGLMLALLLVDRGIEYAAAGASFGATIGGITGLLIILFIYFRNKKSIVEEMGFTKNHEVEPRGEILRNLLKIAVPITIGAAVLPLINMIDTMIVIRRLQSVGFMYEEANQLFGQLSGMAQTLINLPQVLTMALAMSIVPVIAESVARGDHRGIQKDTQSAVRIALLLGLPAALGLAVLATPIMQLLFPREPASLGEIMFYLSFSVLFLTQLQTLTGVLQGLGKPLIPVYTLVVGATIKLVVTYMLTGIPSLHVKGAAIGTVVAYIVAAGLNLIAVKKETGVHLDMMTLFIKPVASGLTMAVVTKIGYNLLLPRLGNSLATVIAIGLGAMVYGVMLLRTGSITKEDFELMPGGRKIEGILRRMRLIKSI